MNTSNGSQIMNRQKNVVGEEQVRQPSAVADGCHQTGRPGSAPAAVRSRWWTIAAGCVLLTAGQRLTAGQEITTTVPPSLSIPADGGAVRTDIAPEDPVPPAPAPDIPAAAAADSTPGITANGSASIAGPAVDGAMADEGETALRGPIHEAFAEQYNQDPTPGIVISRQPPEPIEELPPDVRPDGRDIEWIGGYWAWDEDTEDFFWVSGIWREVPQGFRWVPGYWSETSNGYQWVSGTWVSEQTEEIEYLAEAPPETLEAGPVGNAPTAEHFWIPGCWNWRTTRYVWRPGYWSGGYASWVWIPARYIWTPRGYFFTNGYWDYPLPQRGILFAPYYFRRPFQVVRGYRYTPRIVVATAALQWQFWVRPGYRHYYFGDYYDGRYAGRGFYPWHRFHRQRHCFDPLFAYYSRSRPRGGPDFYQQVNLQFDLFSRNVDRRPRHTLRDQDQFLRSLTRDDDRRIFRIGTDLQEHLRDQGTGRFVRLENSQRERYREDNGELLRLTAQRRSVEGRFGSRKNADGEQRKRNESTDPSEQVQAEGSSDSRLPDKLPAGADAGKSDEPAGSRKGQADRTDGRKDSAEDGVTADRLVLPPSSRRRGKSGQADSENPAGTADRGRRRSRNDESASTGTAGLTTPIPGEKPADAEKSDDEKRRKTEPDQPGSGAGTPDAKANGGEQSPGKRSRRVDLPGNAAPGGVAPGGLMTQPDQKGTRTDRTQPKPETRDRTSGRRSRVPGGSDGAAPGAGARINPGGVPAGPDDRNARSRPGKSEIQPPAVGPSTVPGISGEATSGRIPGTGEAGSRAGSRKLPVPGRSDRGSSEMRSRSRTESPGSSDAVPSRGSRAGGSSSRNEASVPSFPGGKSGSPGAGRGIGEGAGRARSSPPADGFRSRAPERSGRGSGSEMRSAIPRERPGKVPSESGGSSKPSRRKD